MSECTNCGAAALTSGTEGTCPGIGYQRVNVCVPVTVTPYAHAGKTMTQCCGDAVVVSGDKPCTGTKNGICKFTISQIICVEVPVDFGADAVTGDTYVDCLGASSDNICTNCGKEEIV